MNWLKKLIQGKAPRSVPHDELINIVVGGKVVPLIYHTDKMEMVIEDGVAIIRPKEDKKQVIKEKTQAIKNQIKR